jgi:hypothetical protein
MTYAQTYEVRKALTLQIRIREVPGSKLGQDTSCPDRFSWISPWEM